MQAMMTNILRSSFATLGKSLALSLAMLACHPNKTPESSELKDIYSNDASANPSGNARRHAANQSEAIWTVAAGGCSGILLTPEHVLLAAHCKPQVGDTYTSGLSVLSGRRPDLRVKAVLEQSEALDYALVSVSWLTGPSSQQAYPARIAIDPREVFISADPQQGDFLFTVGFPDDKTDIWRATYAEGQAKALLGDRFSFNIGIINGNSGGGVLKKESQMLVAIATSGRKNFGDPGWDKNNPDDPQNWNAGTPTWSIYRQSKVLPQLFPNGKRRDLGTSFSPKTQLYVAVDGQDSPQIWVSANHETAQILLCPAASISCKNGDAQVESLIFREQRGERRFYQRPKVLADASRSVLLQALDSKGQVIGSRTIQIQKRGSL